MTGKTKAEVKEKFAHKEYPIHIIGRHLEVTEPMKAYAVEKLTKANRFGGRIIEATIVMDIQKLVHTVDFILLVNNQIIKVTGRSENIYASIDEAISRLEAKLRRYMSRLREHHAKGISELEMNVDVLQKLSPLDEINDQIEEENLKQKQEADVIHQIVSRKSKPLTTLNQEEAVMKMELSEDVFMIYRSEEDQKLKVIYRRDDGHYGIIEPEK